MHIIDRVRRRRHIYPVHLRTVPASTERGFSAALGRDGRMRRIEGSAPEAVRHDLAEVCRAFNTAVEQLGGSNVGHSTALAW